MASDDEGHAALTYIFGCFSANANASKLEAAFLEYKEIEIEDGMDWLQRAPERIKQARMGKFKLSFQDKEEYTL